MPSFIIMLGIFMFSVVYTERRVFIVMLTTVMLTVVAFFKEGYLFFLF
jgi:hypothetical protein